MVFQKLTESHGIKYAIVGGTLLGAFRDGKLIPWDVDQDVMLEESEYKRLQALDGTLTDNAKLGISTSDQNIGGRMVDTLSGAYVDVFVIKDAQVDADGIVRGLFSFPDFKRSLVFPTDKTIELKGHTFPAPRHTEAFLKSQYTSLAPSRWSWIIGQAWLISGISQKISIMHYTSAFFVAAIGMMLFHRRSRLVVSTSLLPISLGSLLIIVNVSSTIFAQLAAKPDGSFGVDETVAVFVGELTKLLLAIALAARAYLSRNRHGDAEHFSVTRTVVIKMSLPALLYAVTNVLWYVAIGLLGSTKFQLYCNIKVIITAVCYRVIIKRRMTVLQWICLLLLTTGLVVASLGSVHSPDAALNTGEGSISLIIRGISIVVLQSICSALAGVYFECTLKTEKLHPLMQNMILYSWTCLICLAKVTFTGRPTGTTTTFLEGFTATLWASTFFSAMYGQVVALVLYYCDNIVKVFANAATVCVAALADSVLFSKAMDIHVWIAGVIIATSTIVFYVKPDSLSAFDSDVIFAMPSVSCKNKAKHNS